MTITRAFFIPKNAERITLKGVNAEAYLSTTGHPTGGLTFAVGFSGKKQRPNFNYAFKSEQAARIYIDKFLGAAAQRDHQRINERLERQNQTRKFLSQQIGRAHV